MMGGGFMVQANGGEVTLLPHGQSRLLECEGAE